MANKEEKLDILSDTLKHDIEEIQTSSICANQEMNCKKELGEEKIVKGSFLRRKYPNKHYQDLAVNQFLKDVV